MRSSSKRRTRPGGLRQFIESQPAPTEKPLTVGDMETVLEELYRESKEHDNIIDLTTKDGYVVMTFHTPESIIRMGMTPEATRSIAHDMLIQASLLTKTRPVKEGDGHTE